MFNFFGLFKHDHKDLERKIEFIFSLQIAMLRRYNIKEEDIAQLIRDESFISELYVTNLTNELNKIPEKRTKEDVDSNKIS